MGGENFRNTNQYVLSKILTKGQQGIDMARLWSAFRLKPFIGKQRRKRLICKNAFPMAVNLTQAARAYTLSSRITLIKHSFSFYLNGVCIQPGDKKSKMQQIKILFNNYRISSCVNFEYLPLSIHIHTSS